MQITNMTRRWMNRTPTAVLVAIVLMGAFRANVASAQGAKVGIANPSKIFDSIQEKNDFIAKMKTEIDTFKGEQTARAQKLKDQQTQRDMFKPDSPQFQDADKKLLDMSVEFEIYVRSYQAQLERRRKRQIISLFDKITVSVAKVAAQKGLDIVVADVRPELPTDLQTLDQINENALKGLLAQRNVLFNADAIDISAAVIALMDADYKAGR